MPLQQSNEIDVKAWLERFAGFVRDRDYSNASRMFSEDVVGFGTVTPRAEGRNQLVAEQWEKVWDNTTGFTFDLATAKIAVDHERAWAAAQWSSTGQGDNGEFHRSGRATFIFQRDGTQWRAVHSHLSLDPTGSLGDR